MESSGDGMEIVFKSRKEIDFMRTDQRRMKSGAAVIVALAVMGALAGFATAVNHPTGFIEP